MASERFPKAKYIRQLLQMEIELHEWRSHYQAAAIYEQRDWLSGRLDDRAAVLADAAYRVLKAREMLEGVPRLS